MKFTRVSGPGAGSAWKDALLAVTAKAGFYGNVSYPPFEFRNIRVDPNVRGHNVMWPRGRRTRSLSWADWVEFNGLVNAVLDEFKVSANVSTLGGKFIIRRGTRAYTEADWAHLGYQNVGSTYQPVARKDYIVKE